MVECSTKGVAKKKLATPRDLYLSHVVLWFAAGLMFCGAGAFASTAFNVNPDWLKWVVSGVMVVLAVLACIGNYQIARDAGYIDAMHKAYLGKKSQNQ